MCGEHGARTASRAPPAFLPRCFQAASLVSFPTSFYFVRASVVTEPANPWSQHGLQDQFTR
jgi:hypothetical protein